MSADRDLPPPRARAGRCSILRTLRRLGAAATLALLLGAPALPAFAACGLAGQRPCTLIERVPSCDSNLVEAAGQCVRPLCGRDGERACGPERLVFSFLIGAPVPMPCDVDLKLDILSGRCFHPGCGRANDRACTVFERLPSCDTDLTEVAGRCVRPQCGRLNERPCKVPAERLIAAAAPGFCDSGLVLHPIGGLCLRPATPYVQSAPSSTAGVTSPPTVTSNPPPPPPPPAASAPPPLVSAPPGASAPPPLRPGLPPPPPPPPSASAMAAGVSGPWRLNGNGFPGEIVFQQGSDGALTGSVYGDALTGWHAAGDGTVLFLRGQGGRLIQFFAGQLSPDRSAFSGHLYTLNATTSGGSSARNVFGFGAQRQGAPAAAPLPAFAPGPASVAGHYTINGNGFVGALVLQQAADGTLGGTVYGERIEGHYAAGTGTLVFLRYSGPLVIQVFTGTVTGGRLQGELNAVVQAGGASPLRARYAWSAQPAAPAMHNNLR